MADRIPDPQVAAASAYEAFFVPALFAEWAPRLASAAGLQWGQDVLDVACGTGILARAASERVRPAGSVTGIDPNPGMLTVAAREAPHIFWSRGRAEALPFPDATFDAVVSQFGLMFFADRLAAIREMLRVLRGRGRLAVAVWDRLEHSPAYEAEVALLERVAGRQAADALSAPFVLGDRDTLQQLFHDAGVRNIVISTPPGRARFPSVRAMVEADLRGWLPVMGVVLPDDVIARIHAEAAQVLSPFATADGTVEFDSPAHIVTGAVA